MDTNGSSSQEVRNVRKEKLTVCLTCPICEQLFDEATTIRECLHTFCKKCIHDKLINEDLDSCPVCNAYLGTAPLDKLRTDNSLQNLKSKIFGELMGGTGNKAKEQQPIQTKKTKPSGLVQSKKKKKTTSSLVDSFPNIETQKTITKQRSKLAKKNTLLEGSSVPKEKRKKIEQHSPNISITDNVSDCNQVITKEKGKAVVMDTPITNEKDKDVVNRRVEKVCDLNELPIDIDDYSSGQSSKSTTNSDQPSLEEVYLLKKNENDLLKGKGNSPIKKSLTFKSPMNQVHIVEGEITENLALIVDLNMPPNSPVAEEDSTISNKFTNANANATLSTEKAAINTRRVRNKAKGIIIRDGEHGNNNKSFKEIQKNASKSKGKGKMVDEDYDPILDLQSKSYKKSRNKHERKVVNKAKAPKQQEVVHDEEIINVSTIRPARVIPHVWVRLLPCQEKKRGARLPAMKSPYMHIKDPNMPALVLKKHVARSLNIADESKVELMMHGEEVGDSISVRELLEFWCQTTPISAKGIKIKVGSSAEELVMVLTYALKVGPT